MEAAKAEANAAFSAGRFTDADVLYTRALAFLADVSAPLTGVEAEAEAALAAAGKAGGDVENGAVGGKENGTVNGGGEKGMAEAAAAETSSVSSDEGGREVSEKARVKAVLLSNRSFTRVKLEQYGFAINDANDACTFLGVQY